MLRAFLTVAVGGVVLAAAYLALNPPRVEPGGGPTRPVANRYEWLAPVLLVDCVFLVFLGAQATVIFGGHDYLERTTGLTYAEYVHQGFGQLTVATALTLVVVSAAAWKAPRTTAADPGLAAGVARPALRHDLGRGRLRALPDARLPGGLRLHAAPPARRRLRGLAGTLVLGVMAAGVTSARPWLPRAALLSRAGLLFLLAAANPDAWIAQHNLDRFDETGKVDWFYLQGLSADAVPMLIPSRPRWSIAR